MSEIPDISVSKLLGIYNKYESIRQNNLKRSKRYQKTEKGKATKKRYNQKYAKTEAGKAAQRRANQKYREKIKIEKLKKKSLKNETVVSIKWEESSASVIIKEGDIYQAWILSGRKGVRNLKAYVDICEGKD